MREVGKAARKSPARATRPRVQRHAINGVLVLDKPLGLSSNAALQKAKYLLRAKKAGHTGALDPLATGVLPLCFGEATKFSQYLLDADKAYESDFVLGESTSSGDLDGEIVQQCDASAVDEAAVRVAMQQFLGDIEQVPPMYSALKHQGQPLYKLARQGIEVERRPRTVHIERFELLDFQPGERPRVTVSVHCSKGTYIRTLAQDLGARLGVGAHVARLHRTAAGPFSAEQMLSLEALEHEIASIEPYDPVAVQAVLRPVDAGIGHIPAVQLAQEQVAELRLGRKITAPKGVRIGLVRVMLRAAFIGIAESDGAVLQPRRLVVDSDH